MKKQKYSEKFLHDTYTKFHVMKIVLRKLKIVFFFLALNSNHYADAHMRGSFSSEQDATNRALELGCEGIHKIQDKWLPCQNEKELHQYLRK